MVPDRSAEGASPDQTADPLTAIPHRPGLALRGALILYQLLLGFVLLLSAPFLLLRRGSHYRPTLLPRLGRHEPQPTRQPPLWIHAVSVGEVGVAATLARALPDETPLLVTTVTSTGQGLARRLFAKRPAVAVTYLPFDLGFAVHVFFRRFRPRALVLAEADLWPLLLWTARRRGLPVAVVNGRVSDRGWRRERWLGRWRPLRRLFAALRLDPVQRFGVQTEADRQRYADLGVPAAKLHVTGNLKYESPEPARHEALEGALLRLAGERPILIAGSTMQGEDEAVLEAFEAAGGGGAALLLLVPRHPERWPTAADAVGGRGHRLLRRSELGPAADSAASGERPDVVLLDSLGELAGLYRLARSAFIGGTLVPTGGHNPLEAARFGVAVVVGPSMENFREIAEDFDHAQAWARAADAAELGRVWRRFLEVPQEAAALGRRGAALIEANRGALAVTLDLLEPLLAGATP